MKLNYNKNTNEEVLSNLEKMNVFNAQNYVPIYNLISNKEKKKKTPQLEKQDYYFDNEGLMVFTRSYHLKRGFCCNSGCHNCPYPRK